MFQTLVHYFLHLIFIGAIAYWYDRNNWKKYWLVLLATMLVDVDHLVADPIFMPGRCSIGFHILHSEFIIPFYFIGAIFLKRGLFKLIMIGLAFHMITDFIDCLWMFLKCADCELPEVFEGLW